MEEKIITVFCLVDDLLKIMNVRDDVRAKISKAEMFFLEQANSIAVPLS